MIFKNAIKARAITSTERPRLRISTGLIRTHNLWLVWKTTMH